jgi:cytochrome c oxidase subunit 1
LPLFIWAQYATSIIQILGTPVLSITIVLVGVERLLGVGIFDPALGGDPLLFQHLFWFYSHPAVYIMILPAMGIASDVISTFARKPLFGYRPMVYSIMAIAGLGFIVWGHHMFVSGMNPLLGMTFMTSTMMIALPSAIKTFNWLGTLWRGNLQLTAPMLNGLAFVSTFVIGGLSGVYSAATPVDIFLHDTYWIVGHIHYVLFGGSVFGVFAAVQYWFPKMFGRMMNDTWGKIHFVLTFVSFNLVFLPMFILGAYGMPRRIADPYQYEMFAPLQGLNQFMTLSLYVLALTQVFFFVNVFYSLLRGKVAPANRWQANTLEWTVSSPPPHENFHAVPTVYRGPYEYSSPLVSEDWLPQDRRLDGAKPPPVREAPRPATSPASD